MCHKVFNFKKEQSIIECNYHVDYYNLFLTKSTKGEVGYAALSGSLIIKIMILRW